MRVLRCLVVLAAVTGAALLAGRLLWPGVVAPATRFDEQLVRVCSIALSACTAWAWLSAAAVVVEALTAASWSLPGVPGAVRRTVLACCGVAVLAGTAGPALAAPDAGVPAGPQVAVGLPFPARAMDDTAVAVAPAVPRHALVEHHVLVARGDSLWAIAARHLPAAAGDHEISAVLQQLYDLNRAVIGDDPDLIHPGQRLVLPASLGRQQP